MPNRTTKRLTFRSGTKDLFALLSILVLGVGLFCFYWYILRHDPLRDAKRLMELRCKCNETGNVRKIARYQGFLKTFDQQHFKKQEQARLRYQSLDASDDSLQTCLSKTSALYTQLRSNYLNDSISLRLFDSTIADMGPACEEPRLAEIMPLQKQIVDSINAITDEQPDSEQIKRDMLGKKIPGWEFTSASEMRGLRFNSAMRTNDMLEYDITVFLVGNTSIIPGTCDLLVSYIKSDGQWLFGGLKERSITITYTAPLNEYATVHHPENCTYLMNSHDLRYWIGECAFCSAVQAGPDVAMPRLTGNTAYIKSREDRPIAIDFTYYPQNQNQ